MIKLEEINNLAFDLTNEELEPYDYFQIARKVYNLSKPVELNENQQIVLGHLQGSAGQEGCLVLAVSTLANIKNCTEVDAIDDSKYFKKIRKAFWSLTRKQEAEVLQAFAEWGLNHERD